MGRHAEDTPSFNFQMSFQSNMAFLVAIFILLCALAWALRDHRKRLLDLATEEQEDRLYLTVLAILFVVCTMGSYYAFNQTRTDLKGEVATSNVLIDELVHGMSSLQKKLKAEYTKGPAYAPDLPVKLPLPQPGDMDDPTVTKQRYPEEEYNNLTWLIVFFVAVFTAWYFWPKARPKINPPRDYMDMQPGDMGTDMAGMNKSGKRSAASAEPPPNHK